MKTLKLFEDYTTNTEAPTFDPSTGTAGLLYGDKMWLVYVFAGSKDKFKAMSQKEGDSFINLVNVIKGGTKAEEIAGIFKSYDDAKKFYDKLKYRKEE